MKKIIFGLGIIITLLTVLIVSWIRVDTKPAEVATSQVAEPDRFAGAPVQVIDESGAQWGRSHAQGRRLADFDPKPKGPGTAFRL
ncbi:MAG: hypothetical protein UV43_C0003G0018 [Parcubacteria group bacterium GW2011_GWF2_42_7]|nr:MAG: hypothetical protein UV43_C0003G0018 [Parcubacteria group bacterium GW2011_GWF2_42_7]